MKRTVTVTVRHEERIAHEIELPIYREVSYERSTVYTRINEDLSAISIKIHDSEKHFEVHYERTYCFDASGIDYHFGQGVYECTQAQFEEALQQLRTFVERIAPVRTAGIEAGGGSDGPATAAEG